jgi:hypothetical protein
VEDAIEPAPELALVAGAAAQLAAPSPITMTSRQATSHS